MKTVKNISIKGYLAERGVTPKRETAQDGYYLSPLRSESTPSFHVSYDKNLWHDFGIGEGGSIVDLVMRLENCTTSEVQKLGDKVVDQSPIYAGYKDMNDYLIAKSSESNKRGVKFKF